MEQVLFPVAGGRAGRLARFDMDDKQAGDRSLPVTVHPNPKLTDDAWAALLQVREPDGNPVHRWFLLMVSEGNPAQVDGRSFQLALALADRLRTKRREPSFRIFATGEIPVGQRGVVGPVEAKFMDSKVATVTAAADDGDLFVLPAANFRDLTSAARDMLANRPKLMVRPVRHFQDLADLWT